MKQQDDNFVVCPICGKKFKSLITHVFYKHHMSWESFKSLYPNCKVQVASKQGQSRCPVCGKIFNSKAALGTHIAYKHKKTAVYGSTIKKQRQEGIQCPICKKFFVNFSQHIEMIHGLSWKDFVKSYSYKGPSRYITEAYRKHLSENKKHFYQHTAKGKELRQKASELFKTDRNISKSAKAREKISKFASSRNDSFENLGFGYNFLIHMSNKVFKLRSFIEFCCFIDLINAGKSFAYEKVNVSFKDKNGYDHFYKTDFVVDDTIYEIKPFTFDQLVKKSRTQQKIGNRNYKDIYDKYSQIKIYSERAGYKFELVNHVEFCEKLNLYKQNLEFYKNKILNFFELGYLKKITITRKKISKVKLFVEDEKFDIYRQLIEINYF